MGKVKVKVKSLIESELVGVKDMMPIMYYVLDLQHPVGTGRRNSGGLVVG